MLSLRCSSDFFLSLTLFWLLADLKGCSSLFIFLPLNTQSSISVHTCVENTALNAETAELGSVLHSRDQSLTWAAVSTCLNLKPTEEKRNTYGKKQRNWKPNTSSATQVFNVPLKPPAPTVGRSPHRDRHPCLPALMLPVQRSPSGSAPPPPSHLTSVQGAAIPHPLLLPVGLPSTTFVQPTSWRLLCDSENLWLSTGPVLWPAPPPPAAGLFARLQNGRSFQLRL